MSRRLTNLVKQLRAVDPDIVDILQFGSSVYAPRLARDVDLLITTRVKKKEHLYWQAVEIWGGHADLVIRKPRQRMSSQVALAVRAFGRTLYGTGQTQRGAKRFMGIASYDDARNYVTIAEEDWTRARQSRDQRYREARYRLAFDLLFDAARYAAMTFLATSETRWGKLREKLPKPFNTQFRDFISVLHVQYVYEDKFPRDQADVKFQEWRDKVNAFIDGLATHGQTTEDK